MSGTGEKLIAELMGRTENLSVLTLEAGPDVGVREGLFTIKGPFPVLSKTDE